MKIPEFHYLTADDWGLTPSSNDGILNLCRAKILKRVTLMANTKYLTHGLEDLTKLPNLEMGPHINFTYGTPLSEAGKQYFGNRFWGLNGFLFHALMIQFFTPWRFKKFSQVLEQECESQMEKLESLGVQLKFINSHHHSHLFPGVLKAITPCIVRRKIVDVRLMIDHRHWLKSTALVNLFSLFQKKYFSKKSFRWLPCYYPLKKDFESRETFESFLSPSTPMEVILHPAVVEDPETLEFADYMGYQRSIEHAKLLAFYGSN